MATSLSFDCLYAVFEFLSEAPQSSPFYAAMSAADLAVPRSSPWLASCSLVSRTWHAAAFPLLTRFIRIRSTSMTQRIAQLTSDPHIGSSVHGIQFSAHELFIPSGSTTPSSPSPSHAHSYMGHHSSSSSSVPNYRDSPLPGLDLASHRDLFRILQNCPNLRTLILSGWKMGPDALLLLSQFSFSRLTALDIRCRDPLNMSHFQKLLNTMPNLEALACGPAIVGAAPAPTCKLKALVTAHSEFAAYTWLLSASSQTLTVLNSDGMFDTSLGDLLAALTHCGPSIAHLELHASAHLARVLPLCPNVTHLSFPFCEHNFEQTLLAMSAPLLLSSLSFKCTHVTRRASGTVTLSARATRSLIRALETNPALSQLRRLDLDFKPGAVYPSAPIAEFRLLVALCKERGIGFECPDLDELATRRRPSITPFLAMSPLSPMSCM